MFTFLFKLICLFVSPAPASVIDLHVENQGQMDTLLLSWTRGPGALTGYSVSVDGFEQHLGPESTQVVFHRLVAGRLYPATIQTWSENLTNTTTAVGRTGQCCCKSESPKLMFHIITYLMQ